VAEVSLQAPKFEKKRKELHPKGEWTCPSCHTKHEHPHWKDHHQEQKVDKTFCDGFCKESDVGSEFEEDGTPKPFYCPRCGYTEERLQIVKVEAGEVLEID